MRNISRWIRYLFRCQVDGMRKCIQCTINSLSLWKKQMLRYKSLFFMFLRVYGNGSRFECSSLLCALFIFFCLSSLSSTYIWNVGQPQSIISHSLDAKFKLEGMIFPFSFYTSRLGLLCSICMPLDIYIICRVCIRNWFNSSFSILIAFGRKFLLSDDINNHKMRF